MDPLLQTNDIDTLRQLAITAWRKAERLDGDRVRIQREKDAAVKKYKTEKAKLNALESEYAVLLQRIQVLTEKLAKANNRDVQLELELELGILRNLLQQNADDTYGSKSERRPKDDDEKKKKKKKTGHGPTSQPDLPIVPEIHTLKDGDCDCQKCGGDLRLLGECYEESELVASIRRSFVIKKIQRTKHVCKGCGHIRTAPGPLKLIPGGRYDLSFTVQVALDKYLDALPLERQVRRMGRVGFNVQSQTLWDQLHALYLVLLPSFLALSSKVLAEPMLHADETPWRMMGKGRSKKWWMWALVSAAGTLFDLQPSRGNVAARAVFKGYDGIVVADGYPVYTSLEKALDKNGPVLDLGEDTLLLPNYRLAGCWMHARRPLFKAEKNAPEVTEALDLIAELYAIEAEAKTLAKGDVDALLEHRKRLREERSREVIERLKLWRDAQRPLPKTQYAKGVNFLKIYWKQLTLFLDEPLVPVDNGEAERQIRGPVIGRKNYYGVRSERGARVASLFFSLIGTCQQQGVDPFEYLMEAARRGMVDRESVYLPSDHQTKASQESEASA